MASETPASVYILGMGDYAANMGRQARVCELVPVCNEGMARMIKDSYIESLEIPICPICKNAMEPVHTREWTGENSVYTSIRFSCYQSSTAKHGDHKVVLNALTPELWEGTVKHWKLKPASAAAVDLTMTILGEH